MPNAGSVAAITDEAALRRVPQRTTEAWKSHDADRFAAVFAEDTKVVIAGHYLQGREQVRGYMSAAFTGPIKGTSVISEPVMVAAIDARTALVMTKGGVLLPGETGVSPERAIYGTWVLSRSDNEWLISAYHSSPVKD